MNGVVTRDSGAESYNHTGFTPTQQRQRPAPAGFNRIDTGADFGDPSAAGPHTQAALAPATEPSFDIVRELEHNRVASTSSVGAPSGERTVNQ